MYDIEFVKRILDSKKALTIDMSEAISRGNLDRIIYATEHAVMLRHKATEFMLWADDYDEAVKAIECAKASSEKFKMCVCHGEESIKAIENNTEFELGKRCRQYCNYSKEHTPLKGICDIVPLEESDIPIVLKNYHDGSDEYIRRNMKDGTIFKAVIDGKTAGFIGLHSDGSTGMLTVLPEYRRRGIALELESFMQNFEIDKGWIPYGQVYFDNEASIQLQAKIGMTISDGYISWNFEEDDI